jgi:hypothetical protein
MLYQRKRPDCRCSYSLYNVYIYIDINLFNAFVESRRSRFKVQGIKHGSHFAFSESRDQQAVQ